MRKALHLFLLILFFLATACHKKSKSAEIATYDYQPNSQLSHEMQDRLGSWIEEGTVCYGICVRKVEEEVVNGCVIKAKVQMIQPDAIKMRALEKAVVKEGTKCRKMTVDIGDTWWEKEGTLFQTYEEAYAYLHTHILPSTEDTILIPQPIN